MSGTSECYCDFNWCFRIKTIGRKWPCFILKVSNFTDPNWTAYQKHCIHTSGKCKRRISKFGFQWADKWFWKTESHSPFLLSSKWSHASSITHACAAASWPLSGHSCMERHRQGVILCRAQRTCYYRAGARLNSLAMDCVLVSVLKRERNGASSTQAC